MTHEGVLLLSMPWHALERPSLGLSLLQAEVRMHEQRCEIAYLGFDFADFIGLEDYQWVQSGLPYTAFAGDWIFTRALYGDRPDVDARYVQEVLRQTWRLTSAEVQRLLGIRSYVDVFLDHCMRSCEYESYSIVGFTSTFEQNLASLALAKRIKEKWPEVLVAFGGANWEDEMGRALHERFSFVDIVCSGEADRSFPAIVQRVAARRRIDEVPGVVFRRGGRSITTGHAAMIGNLDSLPSPNYDDYFASKEGCASATEVTPLLLLETSRGCWWGAKHHCTFCGLNGGTMAFRSKSAERVIEEIRSLTSAYDIHTISVVDNILDMRYFKTLLPMLADEGLPMNLFYEVKANLTLEQVRLLWAAGIRHVQPGIESLSDHVLDLMDKGTTTLQNVQLLKWCREFGIRPEWNFLYGFPGENAGDYDEITALIDSIDFLQPPSGHGPIRLDRFSPYHDRAQGYGLTNVRPMKPYESLYPFDPATLSRVAYYFDFDYADARDPIAYAGPAIDRMRRWMTSGPVGALWMIELGDRLALVDRRGVERISTLEGWQADVYRACDRATSISSLLKVAPETPEADIRTFLDGSVGRRLMVAVKGRYLALAVHRPPRTSRVEEPNRVALRLVEAS